MTASPVQRPADLAGWLALLETLHPKPIALGLERVRDVLARMGIALACPVVTVTGTNGKGSTSAFCEAMLRAAGYRTGLYTSPHLVRYNERVRIDGQPVDDAALIAAFHAVEDARAAVEPPTPLTYFEFGTLAALWLFARARLDALVLEVGLGGRLDAVNVVDADVAVVTTVDLDHMDYLGPTREDIGREKAGIFRAGRPAICGEPRSARQRSSTTPQRSARGCCASASTTRSSAQGHQWRYRGPGGERYGLPIPALRGDYQLGNAATALAALGCLRDRLPVTAGAMREGLVSVELPGRFQVLPGRPVDGARRRAQSARGARARRRRSAAMGFHPQTTAVFAMLADKDIDGVIAALRAARRSLAGRAAARPRAGASAAASARRNSLAAGVARTQIRDARRRGAAYAAARAVAGEADRIVVFGSFLTVAAAIAVADRRRPAARQRASNRPSDPASARPCPTLATRNSTTCAAARAAASSARSCSRSRPRCSCRCCSKPTRSRSARTCRCKIPPIDDGKFVNKVGERPRAPRLRRRKSSPRPNRRPRRVRSQGPRSPRPRGRRRMRPRRHRPTLPRTPRPPTSRRRSRAPSEGGAAGKSGRHRPKTRQPKAASACGRREGADAPGRRERTGQGCRRRRPCRRPSRAPPRPGRCSPAAAKAGEPPGAEPAKTGTYSVQLAAFIDDKGANALAGKLKKSGYPAYIEPYTTSRGTLWRVRVGALPERVTRRRPPAPS